MEKPAQQFKGKVAEYRQFNNKFEYLDIELIKPHRIEFLAGQHISLDIGGGERRAYSIASAPSTNHAIELCIDVTPAGKGTKYIQNLKPGNELSFMGPLGRFIVGQEKKLLFLAVGSGIAPLRSMLWDLLEDKKDQREMQLHWGLRQTEDMFWEEYFRRYHEYYDNFSFHLSLSQPPEHWPLSCGYVTECIKDELELTADWGVYLCGNREMIEECQAEALKLGVPEKQIHFDKFS